MLSHVFILGNRFLDGHIPLGQGHNLVAERSGDFFKCLSASLTDPNVSSVLSRLNLSTYGKYK